MIKFNIEENNRRLKSAKQNIRILKYIKGKMILNTITIKNNNILNKFKRWVKSDIYIKYIDDLMSEDNNISNKALKAAKKEVSCKGGNACVAKHGGVGNFNKGKSPWNKGKKLHYKVWNNGLTKDNNKKLLQLSIDRTGEKNPMFGKTLSKSTRKKQSDSMKLAIIEGRFTPKTNNRNTTFKSICYNKKFRSSWEAIYFYYNLKSEYETLRLEYNFNNQDHVYIVDFVDHINKIAVEVKPSSLCKSNKVQAKLNALRNWCHDNNYKFILANEDYIFSLGIPQDHTAFDEETWNKVNKFYETYKKKENKKTRKNV